MEDDPEITRKQANADLFLVIVRVASWIVLVLKAGWESERR
jgi:hypothetical protein